MTGNVRSNIDDIYRMALRKITGGKIFGEDIDLGDHKHIAVAMYFLGQKDARERENRYLEAIKRCGI